ncbi:MAG: hypothetical protein HWD86_01725 [Kangiellaceae bacterium]|nr:hypothetical protein [Kangiellaceae bacterium]
MSNSFEIYQGEWTYITDKDNIQILATSNVAQCTVFCGKASNGFSFMFHFDIPSKQRIETLQVFKEKLLENVPKGSEIRYQLTGGWKCLWAPKVRDEINQFMSNIELYKLKEVSHKFTDESEKFSERGWTKGVSFNLTSEEIGFYPKKAKIKRWRPLRAWLPFFQMPLARPKENA